jgi:hypothetical protein
MLYETKFLLALGATSLVEVPSVFVLAKYVFKKKLRWWKSLIVAFLASALTLPYLWFILPRFIDARMFLVYGEAIVFLFEALFYLVFLEVRVYQALVISFIANLLSYYLGKELIDLFFR